MENNTVKEIPSSVFPSDQPEKIELKQLHIPTIALLTVLIVPVIVLSFIFTPDKKRHGK
jgi:hypothetical protein